MRFSVGMRFYPCGPMNKIRNVSESAISGEGKHASLPVIEEQVEIGKGIVEEGGFRLIKKVDEETVEVPLKSHATQYTLERVPVNRYVEAPPPIRQEGDTTIFSVVEEELVVHKRLKVVEELRITSSVKETVKHTEVTLRKERVIVEKI